MLLCGVLTIALYVLLFCFKKKKKKMCTKIHNEGNLNIDYYSMFYSKQDADNYFNELKGLPYYTPTFKIRGKNAKSKRKILAYGESNMTYNFSGIEVPGILWTPLILKLRDDVEKQVGCTYNYVLLNYYEDGASYISHHKDDETCLDSTFPIAVLSFGQARTLEFKKRNIETTCLNVEHGSLYVMCEPTNKEFSHGIPPDPTAKECRISLTFRHILPKIAKISCKRRSEIEKANRRCTKRGNMLVSKNECNHLKDLSLNELKQESIIQEWTLNGNCRVYALSDGRVIKIVINNIELDQNVEMSPATLIDFSEKILLCFYQTSMIINDEVAVFASKNTYILHQVYRFKSGGYYLKRAFLALTREQLEELMNIISRICEYIKLIILCDLIPNNIRKTCKQGQQSQENFFKCVFDEIMRNVEVPCEGCIHNNVDPQFHACMTLTAREKYILYSNVGIYSINFKNICKKVKIYDNAILNDLTLEKYLLAFERISSYV